MTDPTTPELPGPTGARRRRRPTVWIVAGVVAVGIAGILVAAHLDKPDETSTASRPSSTTTTTEPATRIEDAVEPVPTRQLPYFDVGDGGYSLAIDGGAEGFGLGADIATTVVVLDELDTPDVVYSRMERTTSLMGLQEDEFDGLVMRWSYHPDNGLDIIIEDNEGLDP